jgi:hypothetical protein
MNRRAESLKRAETVWQALILLLVLFLAVGIYSLLAALSRQWRAQRAAAGPVPNLFSQDAVVILDPEAGAVFQRGVDVPIGAVVARPGYLQAELLVDGQRATVEAIPDPEAVPWTVRWSWPASEGAHILTARIRDEEGAWNASRPVTITVVPLGQLLFASNRDGAYAIYRMDTAGQGTERLTAGPGAARQPCLLAGPREAAQPDLICAAETGGTGPVIRQQAPGGDVLDIVVGSEPACAPAGRRLAFVASIDGVSQVLAVQPEGGVPQALTAEESYAGQPAWSPDGKQVAYVAERDSNWDIWIAPALGDAGMNRQFARRLTDDPALDWAPAWSPDGSRLAFVSNRGGTHQVYIVQADGTGVEALTGLSQGAEGPSWSPDGFWLAFLAYTGDGRGVDAREIYVMRADGRYPVRLTYNSYDDADVAWTAAP